MLIMLSLGLVFTSGAACQTPEQSPFGLIKFLTYQSDRPLSAQMGLGGCGSVDVKEEQGAAKRLAEWGASALPDLEDAIDSIERTGQRSRFASGARWLLLAYAEINGPAAFPRFRRLSKQQAFLDVALDQAAAVSLSITSYLSPQRVPTRRFLCRRQQPRDGLDQLIVAWQRDDRRLLEASLGPSARGALNSLLQGKTWEELRAALWKGEPGEGIGYRFDTSGQWSQPEGELKDQKREENPTPERSNTDLDTLFKNGSGVDCGRHRVTFSSSPVSDESMSQIIGPFSTIYLVDSSDLGDLLSLIASCATR
jgi:hypothetical protein